MILSFRDQTTQDIYDGIRSKNARKIPTKIWEIAFRKLDMINSAGRLKDLLVPPGNRLKALRGHWKEFHSIRINDQYRIIFKWINSNAENVQILDYHD